MKAVYIREFIGAKGLEIAEVPPPDSPSGTEVLVQVRAAGLNRADLLQAKGLYPPPPGYSPNIPGLEFAGEVVESGPQAAFAPGTRVFGITAGEAQAEFVKVESSLAARIPEALSFTEAAAVPEAFITAYDAMMSQARLSAGETVLIHAVGSGVGVAGLQIAKAFGVAVIGTSRTKEKLEACEKFGLDHAIATDSGPDFADRVLEITGGRGADVVLDLVGGPYFEENLKALAVNGRIMLVGLTGGRSAEFDLGLALTKRTTIKGTVLRPRSTVEKGEAVAAFVRDLLPMFERGKLKPVVDRVFPASQAAEAYEYLASNESFGKVILEW
jgi:NADPH:quinone reductase